jgi:hypothetical protein
MTTVVRALESVDARLTEERRYAGRTGVDYLEYMGLCSLAHRRFAHQFGIDAVVYDQTIGRLSRCFAELWVHRHGHGGYTASARRVMFFTLVMLIMLKRGFVVGEREWRLEWMWIFGKRLAMVQYAAKYRHRFSCQIITKALHGYTVYFSTACNAEEVCCRTVRYV